MANPREIPTDDFGRGRSESRLKGEAIGSFVFQAVRELILNAAKHGHATHVAIRLSHVDEDHIRLMVTDDGVGCDPERLNPRSDSGGFGLFSIRERLDLIGGSLEITSAPGQGTKATIISSVQDSPIETGRGWFQIGLLHPI